MRLAGDTSVVVRFSGEGGMGLDFSAEEEEEDVEEERAAERLFPSPPHILAKVMATLILFFVTSLFTGKNVFLDFMEGVDKSGGVDTGANTGGVDDDVVNSTPLRLSVSTPSATTSWPRESRLSSPTRKGEATAIIRSSEEEAVEAAVLISKSATRESSGADEDAVDSSEVDGKLMDEEQRGPAGPEGAAGTGEEEGSSPSNGVSRLGEEGREGREEGEEG